MSRKPLIDAQPSPSALRIQVCQSPYLDVFYHHPVRVTIAIRWPTIQKLGVKVCKSVQSAHQADGSSPLKVLGEARLSLTRDNNIFHFEGLVVET